MEQIILNLIPGGIPQVCNVSQYDNGRVIRLHLKNGSSDYTLSGTETISLLVSKRDQTTYECSVINTGSSYVDITTVPEMCDVSGESECELTISSGSTVLGTENFKMIVDPDAFDGDLKVKSVSGPIATFETDLAEDLIKLDVDLEPIQDLHGYDNPWPAGGGKNLLKMSELSLIPPSNTAFSNATKRTFSPNSFCLGLTSNNYFQSNRVTQYLVEENNISVTSSANAYAVIIPITNLNIGETYTLSASSSQGKMSVGFWEEDGTFISFIPEVTSGVLSFSVPANTFYVGLSFNPQTNDVQATFTNIQLQKGSTATEWTPYSNICPISGHDSAQLFRTGKNLLDTRQESIPQYAEGSGVYANVTYSPNDNGSITINGTSTGASVLYFNPVTLNPLTSYPFPAWKYTNNQYTFSVTSEWGSVTGEAYIQATIRKKADDSIVSRQRLTPSVLTKSFTVQEDEYISDAFIRISSGASASNINIKIQLELGSTATDYEPYESDPTPVTVQFGQTVYGGTLDSASRVLRVDTRYMVFDGTQEIGLANWRPLNNSVGWLYRPNIAPNIKNYVVDESNLPYCKLKSDRLQTVVYGGAQGLYGKDSPCISLVGTEYWAIGMRVNDPSLTSATAINNWLSQNPIEVVYELAEPIEIPLSAISPIPALVGINNVYSDAGDVEVEYYTTK